MSHERKISTVDVSILKDYFIHCSTTEIKIEERKKVTNTCMTSQRVKCNVFKMCYNQQC